MIGWFVVIKRWAAGGHFDWMVRFCVHIRSGNGYGNDVDRGGVVRCGFGYGNPKDVMGIKDVFLGLLIVLT